jgi:CubicO group peptidase (beta-lactamase class C family)
MSKNAFADVAELLASVSNDQVVPGVAAAAVVDGEVAHAAAHGWRDQERRLPMTTDTPSRWYSISKPVTALALGQLVAAGKLRWDQPVSQLVPGLRFADPVATERATIADCLLHRTGLPFGNWNWWQAPSDPAELLRRLPHIPCSAGFRAGHQYQNLGFTILGEVFKAAGTDWHQAIHDLLEPLGIKPITRLAEFVASDRALGYGPNGFLPAVPAGDFDFEGIAPASAVCGTILELAKMACAMARDGRGLLPPATWAEAIRPELALPDPDWPELRRPCVALAGRSVVYRGELVLQWAGGWRGYVSHLLAIPARRIAACAFANRTSANAAEPLAFSLLDRAAGWERLPWAKRFLDQKLEFRRQGAARLAARLARPSAPWPATDVGGRFFHPGYGELTVTDNRRLQFRQLEVPLAPRPDGTIGADGTSADFSEIMWDLRPVLEGNRVVAWLFGPDDPAAPCRFDRVS